MMLALAQYLFFGGMVGWARGKYDIKAPAITGNVEFERVFRVHQNSMEQLVVFLPSLWAFAEYAHELGAVILGVIFLVARQLYSRAYTQDASKRAPGYVTGYFVMVILLLGGLGGAIWGLVK
jgi:uncharacterized membrane protein YecN with MAPEG domain